MTPTTRRSSRAWSCWRRGWVSAASPRASRTRPKRPSSPHWAARQARGSSGAARSRYPTCACAKVDRVRNLSIDAVTPRVKLSSRREDGGAQDNGVVEEVRDDRPAEPPMLLERARGPVAEWHRRDQTDAVIGVVRRPQREAESERRPRPPPELREPGHHEAVDDDLFVDRGRRRDHERVDDEVLRHVRVVLLVGERVVVEDAGQR